MARRYLARLRQETSIYWQPLGAWFQDNSQTPEWLPRGLRRAWISYLLAVALVVLAVALEVYATRLAAHVDEVGGVFIFLMVIIVGLNWGAAPCLLATLLGTLLLYYVVFPPMFVINHKNMMEILQDGLVLFGGLLMTFVASQREYQRRSADERALMAEEARHQAETVAALMAESQATSERERQRVRSVLESLLAMLAALVQSPAEMALADGQVPIEHFIAWRLAELACYALGCQQVRLYSLEPGAPAPTLLAAVDRSADQSMLGWTAINQRASFSDWLDAGMLLRLHTGEIVQVELPQPAPKDARAAPSGGHLLVVPIRHDTTLLGMLSVDDAQGAHPDLGLTQAIARLSAMVLEKERLVRERAQAQADALAQREATRRLEMFLGIVSHELKTPLTIILLGLQVMQRRVGSILSHGNEGGEARLRPAVETRERGTTKVALQDQMMLIYQQGKRLESLVDELLDNSRIEAGQFGVHLQQTDLRGLVSEVVEEQRALNPGRVIALETLPAQTVRVEADAERVRQVIGNYLTNALKYSAEARPVDVGLEVEQKQARIWVRDEGAGIPFEQQPHVWERFYRVPGIEVLTGSKVGLGLGLYITKAIIERHQGQVGVQSTPGQGSTFWCTLPLAA